MKRYSRGGVTDELLGTWVFNDSLTAGDSWGTVLITFDNSLSPVGYSSEMNYANSSLYYGNVTIVNRAYGSGTWQGTYQTITITDTSNLTNREAFTTWLKANATKQ